MVIMKLLKDLTISRKEFADWTENLTWSRDGTVFLTTYPELTVCQPVYCKQVGRCSKDLFHVKEYSLSLPNKLEFDLAEENVMLNSQPESFIKLCRPSPVDDTLAVLTNNGGVCFFNEQELIAELDEQDKTLKERTYHALDWSPDGTYFAVGNEDSEVVIFSVSRSLNSIKVSYHCTIKLSQKSSEWVIGIEWNQNSLVAFMSDNSVHTVSSDYASSEKIKEPSRFKITDLRVINNDVLVTSTGFLHRISLIDGSSSYLDVGMCDSFYIVPLKIKNSAIIISNKTSCMIELEGEMKLQADNVISPHIEAKFGKWNRVFNEFNKYETNFFIYGLAISPDGSSLAILYNIDRTSIRYRIVSELQYRICFIPLNETWTISQETAGLAWYQNYHIYNQLLPEPSISEQGSSKLNVNTDLQSYLLSLLKDNGMNRSRFMNFISETKENSKYKEAIFRYAEANKQKITNTLDKACVQSLANLLSRESPVQCDIVVMKSDFITESFNFHNSSDPDVVTSEEGHIWKRCSVTLLPLMTTKVKICPVSDQRIIDIKQDVLNDYGWFTRTILEVLNNDSIYSGTKMLHAQ